ncbi:helix-turn-helix domain-containing protein [Streptomyces sp. NBC_01198]|uniref:helix-turn-helix domain-containing protein n=1 Tax=Streptomyces sp. NBC_01198 TaxID=2903769 RepID=UPI002E148E5D|nr:XRE family transcriptional regulator [Streptomyces sp. NBC_01198]
MTARRDGSPETTRLTQGLRDLKARAGLSLAGLAAKTTYSKSSWERYLNGKALPPRRAVEELCGLTGEPAGRLLTLLELSSRFADGTGGPSPGDAPPPPARAAGSGARVHGVAADPDPPGAAASRVPRRRPRWSLYAVVALGCVAAAAAGLAIAGRPAPDRPPTSAAGCRDASCEGRSPSSTLCGTSAATLATDRASGGEVIDIRYSPRCLTVWARLSMSRVGDRIDVGTAGGRTNDVRVTDTLDATGYVHTPMAVLGTRHDVRVCLQPAAGSRQCFTARVAS